MKRFGDLSAGRLVRVLPDWSLPDADIVALLNSRSVRSLRMDNTNGITH